MKLRRVRNKKEKKMWKLNKERGTNSYKSMNFWGLRSPWNNLCEHNNCSNTKKKILNRPQVQYGQKLWSVTFSLQKLIKLTIWAMKKSFQLQSLKNLQNCLLTTPNNHRAVPSKQLDSWMKKQMDITCNWYNKYHCNSNCSSIVPTIFGTLHTAITSRDMQPYNLV